jgi:hypothetical protein
MNPYTLGKLADIHIQSLMEGAGKGRNARRVPSLRLSPRRQHHFHWHKKSVERPPHVAALTK